MASARPVRAVYWLPGDLSTILLSCMLALLLLLAVAPWATRAEGEPSPYRADPASYVLTLEDLPSGFRVINEQTDPLPNELWLSKQMEQAEAQARLDASGRIGGYASVFERSGSSALVGTAAVNSAAVVFRSPEHAHAAFLTAHQEALSEGWEPVSGSPLGDEWRAYSQRETTTWGPETFEWRSYRIHVRTQNVALCLITTATVETAELDDAQAFARLMILRIR